MRLRLHHRIVVPFAAVAIAALVVVSWVAYRVTSSTLSAHLRQDVVSATAVVSRGLATTPGVLQAVKGVTGADVITFGPDGLIATTLDDATRVSLGARVMAGAAGLDVTGPGAVVAELDGRPMLYAAYHAVSGEPGVVVALVHENTEIERANRMLLQTIAGAAVASLLGMIVVSAFVARRVTAPIQQLAAFAESVAPRVDGSAPAAAETSDEVGRLRASLDAMLDRLEQSRAALVRSEKLGLAGLFAARVAHDVRNPLSAIKMQAQLLAGALPDGPAGDEGREITAAILHDIAQVESVVKGLLDVARPDALTMTPGVIGPVIQQVVRQLGPQCRHRRVALECELAPSLPELSLDAGRLGQALLNLVTNAVEAVREGGHVRITAAAAPSGDAVVIAVEDDGVGIDPAAVARLFDPFMTTKPGGVGLGLVNARAAVEGHGGTIQVAPRLPSGTRVVISLPVPGVPTNHG